MNKVKELKFGIYRWFFAKVLGNTVFTIILTAAFSSFLVLYIKVILERYYPMILAGLGLLVILYYAFSYEVAIKKVKLNDKSLNEDWTNYEVRLHIQSIASITRTDKALFLQFMDIPLTLNAGLPNNYALEFKAKAIRSCLTWCVNVNIEGQQMWAYMFQYNPFSEMLRPHFLMGYDASKLLTIWVSPETTNSPLQSVEHLVLKNKNGWYFIRTEVYQYETTIKMPDLDSDKVKEIVPVYYDEQKRPVTFDRSNINKVVEIKIYDMNDLGKNICHIFFNEPPYKCFWGGQIGFRNHGVESALYKDIVLKYIDISW